MVNRLYCVSLCVCSVTSVYAFLCACVHVCVRGVIVSVFVLTVTSAIMSVELKQSVLFSEGHFVCVD